jgi:hypothetical protein
MHISGTSFFGALHLFRHSNFVILISVLVQVYQTLQDQKISPRRPNPPFPLTDTPHVRMCERP